MDDKYPMSGWNEGQKIALEIPKTSESSANKGKLNRH